MQLIKRWVRGVLHSTRLIIGLAIYLGLKKTPAFAYQSMVSLFCLTRGYSNDLLSWVIGILKRPYRFQNVDGILGNMADQAYLESITAQLREQGFYIFKKRLPDDLCDQLLHFATTHSCEMRPMDGDQSGKPVATIYHRGAPQSVRYDFDTQDLLDNVDTQKILADLSFAAVAQSYLGARPVVDVFSMWWHTAFSDKPDSAAAQYFHFDMDRPKWIKFFIYLTDVETTNGPHTFVAGSHKSGRIPSGILKKGYARLMDEEVKAVFNERDIIEFAAPRGTILAEDTRGLHKGKHVTEGDRLVLQVQFSNSLFGGYYPKARMGSGLCDELKCTVEKFPELYAAYM